MDKAYLRYKMDAKKIDRETVIADLGWSRQTYYDKIYGRSEWKEDEIRKIRELLGLSMPEIETIFF